MEQNIFISIRALDYLNHLPSNESYKRRWIALLQLFHSLKGDDLYYYFFISSAGDHLYIYILHLKKKVFKKTWKKHQVLHIHTYI